MKASDLRIRNWIQDVQHFKGFFQVEAIAKHTVISPDWTLEWSEVAPIELTEEWLIKFGFKVQDSLMAWGVKTGVKFIDLHENIYLAFFGSWHLAFLGEDECRFDQLSERQVQYVHEFQNLYFALTGEELVIK